MARAVGLYVQSKDSRGLTKRQAAVYDGLMAGKTQLEIASEVGVSRQRVRQIVEDLQRKGLTIAGVKPPPMS